MRRVRGVEPVDPVPFDPVEPFDPFRVSAASASATFWARTRAVTGHGPEPSPTRVTNSSTRSGSNWMPRLALELVDRRDVGHGRAVRPVRDHRLVGVGDGDDARPDRDLRAGEAVRVAATVEPLVVMEHDRGRVADCAGLLEHDLADLRVLDDRPPLGRRERRRASTGSRRGSRACRGRGAGWRSGFARCRHRAARSPGRAPPTGRRSAATRHRPSRRAPRATPRSWLFEASNAARPILAAWFLACDVDGGAADVAVVVERPVRLDLVAPALLRLVQRPVRLAQQPVDVEAAGTRHSRRRRR